ncbi:MAG TPA: hypothetical protein PKW62_05420, partial [Chitinophagaceae bacterium]|nr:hypothetical protein [Chitinophagaceae bacterium]
LNRSGSLPTVRQAQLNRASRYMRESYWFEKKNVNKFLNRSGSLPTVRQAQLNRAFPYKREGRWFEKKVCI